MTKDKFNALYERLGLSDKGLAQALEVNPSTVWRWRVGDTNAPDMVRTIMEMLIKEKNDGQ